MYPTHGVTHEAISLTSLNFSSSRGDASSGTSGDTSRGWASVIVRDFNDPDTIVFSSDENVCDTYWSDETGSTE